MTRVKLNALTGLRIVAAGMIVAHHARGLHIPVPNYALDHGVSFFFVLSGFVLSYAYPKLDSSRAIGNFLVARFGRIWPAHFVALLFALVLLQMPLNRTFAANVLLLQGWVPSWPWYFSYNGVSWSISTEWFFYLAFPVLIFQWGRSWWWKWLASAALIVALIRLGVALQLPDLSQDDVATLHGLLYINPLARLFEFITGMVACSAFVKLRSVLPERRNAGFTVLEILTVAIVGYLFVNQGAAKLLAPYFQGAGDQWLGHASDVLIFPWVIVVFAFNGGWLSRFFGSAPLVLLGDLSFSIYLLHWTIFGYYVGHWQTDPASPDYLGLAVCIAATLVLAFVSWAVVEVPCRAAAKRWLKNRSASMSAPSVSQEQA